MAPINTNHLSIALSLVLVFGILAHDNHLGRIVMANHKDNVIIDAQLDDIEELAAKGRHTHSESGSVSGASDNVVAELNIDKPRYNNQYNLIS